MKIIFTLIFLISFTMGTQLFSDELDKKDVLQSGNEFSFFSGIFDYTDNKKNSEIIGIQHQNDNLYRNSFIGKIKPVTGFMITSDAASYLYTGIQAEYDLGKLNITPSFTPGLYNEGDGKDLGHLIEFKSELQLSFDISDSSELGLSYNHVSNGGLGDINPGADSYMFNFMKSF